MTNRSWPPVRHSSLSAGHPPMDWPPPPWTLSHPIRPREIRKSTEHSLRRVPDRPNAVTSPWRAEQWCEWWGWVARSG